MNLKQIIFLFMSSAFLCSACTQHRIQVEPIKTEHVIRVEPMEMTINVNVNVRVDKALDDFFGDIDATDGAKKKTSE